MASALSRTNSASSARSFWLWSRRLFGSTSPQLRADCRVLLIRGGQNHQPHHVFHVPAALAKFHREPVYQFGMRGEFPLGAELLRLVGKAVAENLFPEPVHKRARRPIGRASC